MRSAVVTGAAGFTGYHLVQALKNQGIFVYAIVRPLSPHRVRLEENKFMKIIETDMRHILDLQKLISVPCDAFYHLAWEGQRNAFYPQYQNVQYTLDALEIAKALACKKFICTGSQAEYGRQEGCTTEKTLPEPITAYGSAKLAACHLSRFRAEQSGIQWIWARVFSLYGLFDNPNALIPYLIRTLRNNEIPQVSSATQNWDYLHAVDGADALVALGTKPIPEGIYQVASGQAQPLRDFIEIVKKMIQPNGVIHYDNAVQHAISLQPSIEKLQRLTMWKPRVNFNDGIFQLLRENTQDCLQSELVN